MMQSQHSEPTFTGSLVVLDDGSGAEETTFTGSIVSIEPDDPEGDAVLDGAALEGAALDDAVLDDAVLDDAVLDDAVDATGYALEEISESYIVPVEYDSESELDTVVSGPPDAVASAEGRANVPKAVASRKRCRDEITGVLDCVPDDDEVEETLEKESFPPKPKWHGGPLLHAVPPAYRTPLPPIPAFEPAKAARSRSPRSCRVRLVDAPRMNVPRASPLPPPPRVPTGLGRADSDWPRLSERRAAAASPRLSDYPTASVRPKLPAPSPPPSAPEHDAATLPGRRALASKCVRMRVEPRELPDSRLDARDSVVPVAQSVERTRKAPAHFRVLSVAAGALCGIALFLIGTLILQARARAAAAGEAPALIVTVAQVGGFRVAPLEVFVDGTRRCEASPCVIAELKPGFHFVSVVAPGFIAPAPRALRTLEGESGNVHFDLTPEQQTFTEVAADSIDVSALPAEIPAAAQSPMPEAQEAPVAPVAPVASAPVALPRPKPAMQFGYLNLNSIPASNVVVDGRPLGQTPQVSEKLAAGSHSVVFIHPERGRRAQSVVLAPGARRTVAVRF